MQPILRKPRWLAFFSLLIVIPAGFFTKFYTGTAAAWLNHYVGGALYEIAWCLLFFGLFPKKKSIVLVPLWVFAITCLLEILQLWRLPLLQLLRSSLIGRLLLGTTFSWWDFLYYGMGCLLGWLWLRQIWQYSRVRLTQKSAGASSGRRFEQAQKQ